MILCHDPLQSVFETYLKLIIIEGAVVPSGGKGILDSSVFSKSYL